MEEISFYHTECVRCGGPTMAYELEGIGICDKCAVAIEKTKDITPKQRLALIQRIVKNHQYNFVDGVLVDAFTANAIMTVYNAISNENQEKLISFPVGKIVTIVWKLLK